MERGLPREAVLHAVYLTFLLSCPWWSWVFMGGWSKNIQYRTVERTECKYERAHVKQGGALGSYS